MSIYFAIRMKHNKSKKYKVPSAVIQFVELYVNDWLIDWLASVMLSTHGVSNPR